MIKVVIHFKSRLIFARDRIRRYLIARPWIAQLILGTRGKLLISACCALLVWSIGYGHFYQEGAKKLVKIKKRMNSTLNEIQEMNRDFPDLTQEQDALEKKNRLVESIRERLESEEERLPRLFELSDVLDQLTASKEQTSVSILGIKPADESDEKRRSIRKKDETEEPKFYPDERFTVELLSGFWELVSYLSRLEQISMYFSFPELRIETDKKESGPPRVHLDVGTLFHLARHSESRGDAVFQEDVEPFSLSEQVRDPFGDYAAEEEVVLDDNRFKVSGVISKGGRNVAIINNEVVKVGDSIEKALVVSIDKSRVVINDHGQHIEIRVA